MCVFLSYILLFSERRNNTGGGGVGRSSAQDNTGRGEVKQVNCSRNIICAPSIGERHNLVGGGRGRQ